MIQPRAIRFSESGAIPNNPVLPVLLYERAVEVAGDPAAHMEHMFAENNWAPDWRDGIYDFHHYHSTAHEALGIARGHARVVLGGEEGEELELFAGDVVVLPAGTGHKWVEGSADFLVVGAYPRGQDWDFVRGDELEKKAAAVERIASVPLPRTDPVLGISGPLIGLWGVTAQT